MTNNNLDNIKKLTNQKIGYALYQKEEEQKMKKLRKTIIATSIFALCLISTITVNATTDGALVEGIKNIITIKLDGQDKNAKCTKKTDGSINCKLDQSLTGEDHEVEVEVIDGAQGNIEVEYNQSTGELNTIIK